MPSRSRLASPIRTLTVGSLPGDPPSPRAVPGRGLAVRDERRVRRPPVGTSTQPRNEGVYACCEPHDTPMLTIILTRHGETDKSHPEQYLGQRIPAALTETGRAAARALGERLADVHIGRVISSPLTRAVETAALIRQTAEVETDDRLMEADYGDWEGHTLEQIEAGWPGERQRWEADPASFGTPNGESGEDVARRVRASLEELGAWAAGAGPGARVLLVGHSTLNRVLLCEALGVPLRDYRRRFRQDWANLTVLRFAQGHPPRALLLVANDVSHLHGISGATWD